LGTAQDKTATIVDRNAVGSVVEEAKVIGMSIYNELEKLGYEYDHEYGGSEERTEVWVNREAGTGVLIEWFNLAEVPR